MFNGKTVHSAHVGDSDQVNSVAFPPDGKYIASGSNDKTIQIVEY